jgi:hypothetical protein
VQPVLEIQDAQGNRVSDSSAAVTASLSAGADGQLSGSLTIDAVAGLASFTDLSLAGRVGVDYELTFEAAGLTSVASQPLTLTPGAAAPGTSELTVTPLVAPLLADGRSTVLLNLVLRDAQGNLLNRGGDAVLFTSELGSVSAASDAGDGSYSAMLTAGTVPGVSRVGAVVNGVVQSAAAEVAFIEATAEVLLEIGARRFGDATTPFGPLPEVLPGDVLELRITFTTSGTDAASTIALAVDLPLSFVLVPDAGGSSVDVVCPSLIGASEPLAPIVLDNRLLGAPEGLQLRLLVDEVCERSEFAPGERGSVTFRVGVK